MKRAESIARILFAGIFAVCAVGDMVKGRAAETGLMVALAALFLWRSSKP